MDRRKFNKTLAAGALLPMAASSILNAQTTDREPDRDYIWPDSIRPGDKIGIIAPGTSVSDPDDLARASGAANHFGLQPVFAKHLESGRGYKSRSIDERLEDLHEMFDRKDIKAVFCVRGGYGSGQLLDRIDYEHLKQNPKIFCGYSDITAMHLAINKMAGLVTFHGPVMLSGFSKYTAENMQSMLMSNWQNIELKNSSKMNGIHTAYPLREIVPGQAQGPLTGGNLSLISSLMGTPYEIETKGRILFIEDVGEEPYRMDRMFTQLRLSGKLKQAAGIIIGKCSGCDSNGLQASRVWDYALGEIIDQIFGGLNCPVIYGYSLGHTSDQMTLPLGAMASIRSDSPGINISRT